MLYSLAKFWGNDEAFSTKLKAQCDLGKSMCSKCKSAEELYEKLLAFGTLFTESRDLLLSVVLVMPFSSGGAERNFSSMKSTNNYLRSTTITGPSLYNLGVISTEKVLSHNLLCHPDVVVDELTSQKARRYLI